MTQPSIKVIKAGKLIDGTGNRPITNATVIIDGKKILSVGKDLEIPEGAQVIDANDRTVMPGMIDSHIHIWGSKSDGMVENFIRPRELGLIKAIDDCKAMLSAGYTTAKCCGGTHAVNLKQSVEEGTLSGLPRIIAAGHPLSQTSGHADNRSFPPEYVDARTSRMKTSVGTSLLCDGVEECIKATRFALRFGADFIKVMTTGGVSSSGDFPNEIQFNIDEIKAIVNTASHVGKYVTAHCQNSRGAKNSILGGIKTIDHANEVDDEVIALAQKHDAIFVSSLATCHTTINRGVELGLAPYRIEKAKTQWDLHLDSYERIRKSDAIMAAGTDFFGSVPKGLPTEVSPGRIQANPPCN